MKQQKNALSQVHSEPAKKPLEKFRMICIKIGKRNLIIACSVLMIGVAVLLNFVLFTGNGKNDGFDGYDQPSGNVQESPSTDASNTGTYFSATQVSRQRARDEALEVLQSVVESEGADEATKTAALLEIAELAKAMEAEANIESLVLSKGFTQCVAVINGDACSVVVNGTELQQSQISQINEIVYEQAGILPQSIRIIAK